MKPTEICDKINVVSYATNVSHLKCELDCVKLITHCVKSLRKLRSQVLFYIFVVKKQSTTFTTISQKLKYERKL